MKLGQREKEKGNQASNQNRKTINRVTTLINFRENNSHWGIYYGLTTNIN